METVASRIDGDHPGVVPAPGGTGRLNSVGGRHRPAQPDTPASRRALRYARDVLADLRQCDSAG